MFEGQIDKREDRENLAKDELFEKDYETFNDAILQAIVSSLEVKELLIKFKKQKETNDIEVLNLFLSLDELCEIILENGNKNSCDYKKEPSKSSAFEYEEDKKIPAFDKNKNFIDGKSLTLNEILFENFCQEKFNE